MPEQEAARDTVASSSPPPPAFDEVAFRAELAALDANLGRMRARSRRAHHQLAGLRTCGCLLVGGVPLLLLWGLLILVQPRYGDTGSCSPQPCATFEGVGIQVAAAKRPPIPPGQDPRYFSDWRVFLTIRVRNDSGSAKEIKLGDLQVGYANQDPGAWGHPDSSNYFAGCDSGANETVTLGPGASQTRTICFDSYEPKDSLALYWQTSLYGKTKVVIPGAR